MGKGRHNFSLISKRVVLLALGFALFWPLQRTSSFTPLLVTEGDSISNEVYLIHTIYFILVFLFVILLVLLRKNIEQQLASSPIIFMASAAGSSGAILLHLAHELFDSSPIIIGFGIALQALFLGAMVIVWGITFSSLDAQEGAFSIVLSATFSSILYLFFYYFPMVDVLRIILSPLVSGILLFFGKRNLADGDFELEFSKSNLMRIPLRIVVVSLILILVLNVYIRLLSMVSENIPVMERTLTQFGLIIFFASLATLIYFKTWTKRTSSTLLVVQVVIALAGLLAVMLFDNNIGFYLGAGIMKISCDGLQVFVFIVLVFAVSQSNISRVLVFGVFGALDFILSSLITSAFVNPLNTIILFQDTDLVPPVTATISFIIFSVVLLGLNLGHNREKSEALEPEVTIKELCEKAAAGVSLTHRELDVMVLYCQGHSLKKVADMLNLAPSTVQGYLRSLFSKLDLHSRQDLIDLVNKQR